MGKPVEITLRNGPIALGALFLVEADSHAVADPADRYVAHLIFGGRAGTEGGVSAFYADSFGGDFTAVGTGVAASDGFEVAYVYPDAVFVNRWARTEGGLTWTIAARNAAGPEQAFAAYELTRGACVEG